MLILCAPSCVAFGIAMLLHFAANNPFERQYPDLMAELQQQKQREAHAAYSQALADYLGVPVSELEFANRDC